MRSVHEGPERKGLLVPGRPAALCYRIRDLLMAEIRAQPFDCWSATAIKHVLYDTCAVILKREVDTVSVVRP